MKSIYGIYFKFGIIFWAVCFVILLLGYLAVLSPQEHLRDATNRKFTETKNLAQLAREAAQEKNKKLLFDKLSKSGEKLNAFVIEQENAANLTLEIGQISSKVKLGSFSSAFTSGEGTLRTENYKYIIQRQIDVNFNSSFNKFALFLNTLERRQPVVFIDTFSITRSEEVGTGNKVNMKLAVLVGKNDEAKGVDG